jgi:hypothetical protein
MFKRSALFLLFLFCLNAHAQTPGAQLQEMYVSYLKEQGYQPSVDSDGDVRFKAEGSTLYIGVDEKDSQSFRIVLPNFWKIESPEEKAKAYEAANSVNRQLKVAKVYIVSKEDRVWADANIYVEKPEDFKRHFPRMVQVLMIGASKFREAMRN